MMSREMGHETETSHAANDWVRVQGFMRFEVWDVHSVMTFDSRLQP